MAEYIEREAAINSVYEAYADGGSAYDALIALPTADVVPVVRCKDCQYCHADRAGNIGCFNYSHYQTSWGGKIKPEDYCSLGRKREA